MLPWFDFKVSRYDRVEWVVAEVVEEFNEDRLLFSNVNSISHILKSTSSAVIMSFHIFIFNEAKHLLNVK